jgi:hypothetical protein
VVFCLSAAIFSCPLRNFYFLLTFKFVWEAFRLLGRERIFAITSLLFMLNANILMTELCNEEGFFEAKSRSSMSFQCILSDFSWEIFIIVTEVFMQNSRAGNAWQYDIHNYFHAKGQNNNKHAISRHNNKFHAILQKIFKQFYRYSSVNINCWELFMLFIKWKIHFSFLRFSSSTMCKFLKVISCVLYEVTFFMMKILHRLLPYFLNDNPLRTIQQTSTAYYAHKP